jgi:hypothetical protein
MPMITIVKIVKEYKNDLQIQAIFIWLGRRDSNPRMPGPKPGALPLGHVPIAQVNE